MKTIYLLLLTALLAVGTAACSKEDNGGGAAGDGFGKVNMAFSLESGPPFSSPQKPLQTQGNR